MWPWWPRTPRESRWCAPRPPTGPTSTWSPSPTPRSTRFSRARRPPGSTELTLVAIGAFGSGLVAGALRLTADYVATREQFGRPLSTFQTVAAQLSEVYIVSRTIDLLATSVAWRSSEDLDAAEDLAILGYWLTSQAPSAMRLCHHLHGGMGMDITYPMDRYYSSVKDLTRLLGGPAQQLDRLDRVGA
ncbi:MAG: acyl-CoA dehydrogenase family protein [Paludibaculum sp.]